MNDLGNYDLTPAVIPSFTELLVTIADFLPADIWTRIVAEIEALGDTKRSYVPLHKQGGTIAYESLREHAPTLVALYQSPEMRRTITAIVGLAVETTPLADKSS